MAYAVARYGIVAFFLGSLPVSCDVVRKVEKSIKATAVVDYTGDALVKLATQGKRKSGAFAALQPDAKDGSRTSNPTVYHEEPRTEDLQVSKSTPRTADLHPEAQATKADAASNQRTEDLPPMRKLPNPAGQASENDSASSSRTEDLPQIHKRQNPEAQASKDESASNQRTEQLPFQASQNLPVDYQTLNETNLPGGSDIWNESSRWIKVNQWHPAGVVSNLGDFQTTGTVTWNDVSFVSLPMVMVCSNVAYPTVVVVPAFLLAIVVSLCLRVKPDDSGDGSGLSQPAADPDNEVPTSGAATPTGTSSQLSRSESLAQLPLSELPVVSVSSLSARSQVFYRCWVTVCCSWPSIMVFFLPVVMVCLSHPYPQEVLIALTMVSSAMIFHNGIYMVVFAWRGILELALADGVNFSELVPQDVPPEVLHWVILPQYKEDVDVVSMALRSVAQCSNARSAIGVVLAMEAREAGAEEKVSELRQRFEGEFKEIRATYHPAGLPNDPPGKASNLSWAFKQLVAEMTSEEEMAKVVLTVADADSEFAEGYFESLSASFLKESPRKRYRRLWQSPVLHVKNYNRLPQPVIVGTVFTTMQEVAALCDPNAVRLPYSSYSLSMNLARAVGGWDAEWIAEDYHMGIKCFLLTWGETTVEPIMLPTMNYVPEVLGSAWGTCNARWIQAKRHALGFSDFSYFFMMLPLVCASSLSKQNHKINFRNFVNLISQSALLIIRLVNCHVVIGVLSTYSVFELLLKLIMKLLFRRDRTLDFLLLNMGRLPSWLFIVSILCTCSTGISFVVIYKLVEKRAEGTPVFHITFFHAMRNAISMLIWSPVYCAMIGFAIWKAALSLLTQSTFEYEVALKPVPAGVTAEAKKRISMENARSSMHGKRPSNE